MYHYVSNIPAGRLLQHKSLKQAGLNAPYSMRFSFGAYPSSRKQMETDELSDCKDWVPGLRERLLCSQGTTLQIVKLV